MCAYFNRLSRENTTFQRHPPPKKKKKLPLKFCTTPIAIPKFLILTSKKYELILNNNPENSPQTKIRFEGQVI